MEEKRIGGRILHPIGIGTWTMGGARFDDGTVYADYDHDDEAVDAIRYSLSKGQNHIDTAQLYGAGHTEEIVGKAIRGMAREEIFLASKVFKSHALRSSVRAAVEGTLKRLGTDYLDLLYVHEPWDMVPMEEYIFGINDAFEAGLARSIGVSNFNMEQLKMALSMTRNPLVANQIHYNLLERSVATPGLLKFCRENEIMIVAYRPVERKLLTDQTNSKETNSKDLLKRSQIVRIARKYGKTVAQIAINWLICQPGVVAIPKAVHTEHIDENLGALDFGLDAEDRELLERLPELSV